MKLTINLCTRGRPELLAKTIETTLHNIALPQTILMVSCDEDDPTTIETAFRYIDRCAVSVKPREDSVGEKFNRALKVAPADCYLFQSDYASIITPGFDHNILEAAKLFPDGIGVVYGPLVNLSFPACQVITSGLAEQLGYLYPTWFPYWFIDHWIDDIAKGIGRIAYADVAVDTSRRPAQTTALREPAFWATFYDACRVNRHAEVEHILGSVDFHEPVWRKKMLRDALPLIDQRSMMINDFVRAKDQEIERSRGGNDPDQVRYRRIKKRAIEELTNIAGELRASN